MEPQRLQELLQSRETGYDPWKMLGTALHSEHCPGSKSYIVGYDHTGWIMAECDCGAEYTHDFGAFDKHPSVPLIF